MVMFMFHVYDGSYDDCDDLDIDDDLQFFDDGDDDRMISE